MNWFQFFTCRNSREKQDSHQNVQQKKSLIRLKRLQSHLDSTCRGKIIRWVIIEPFFCHLVCQKQYSLLLSWLYRFLNLFQMRLENVKAGRKGNLNIATEVTPKLHCILLLRDKFWICSSYWHLLHGSSDFSSGSFSSYGRSTES